MEIKNKKNKGFSSSKIPFIDLLPKEAKECFANLGKALHDSVKNLSQKYSAEAYDTQVIIDFTDEASSAFVTDNPNLLGFAEVESDGLKNLCAYYIININYNVVRGNFDYITTGILDKKLLFEHIKADFDPELEYRETLTGNLLAGTIIHELTHMANMHIAASIIPDIDRLIKNPKYMPKESILDEDSTFLDKDFAVASSIIKRRPNKFSFFKAYRNSDLFARSIAEMEASSSELMYVLSLGATALKAFNMFFNDLIFSIERVENGKKDILISNFLNLLSQYNKNNTTETLETKNKKLVEALYVLASSFLGRKKEEIRQIYKNILKSITPKGRFGWLDLMNFTYSENFHSGINYTTILNDVVFYTAYTISKFEFDESKGYSFNFQEIKKEAIHRYLIDFAFDLDVDFNYFKEYFSIYENNVINISQFLREIDKILELVRNNDKNILNYFSNIEKSKFKNTRFFKELIRLRNEKLKQKYNEIEKNNKEKNNKEKNNKEKNNKEKNNKEKEESAKINSIIESVKEIIMLSFAELGDGYDQYILYSIESKNKQMFLERMLTIKEFTNIAKWINLGFYDVFDRKSFVDTLENKKSINLNDYEVLGNMDSALLFLLKSYEIFVEEVGGVVDIITMDKLLEMQDEENIDNIIDNILNLISSIGDINSNNVEYKKKMLKHYQKALKGGKSKSTGLDKILGYTDVPNFSDNYLLLSCIYHTYMFCLRNMAGFSFTIYL